MREIDPKTLKKAAPRPDPKTLEQVLRVVDFKGVDTVTGKVAEAVVDSKFTVYTERMNAGSSSAIMSHPTKIRVVSVIFGELVVNMSGQTHIVTEGHNLEILPNTEYRLSANSICVFTNILESNYTKRLQEDKSTVVPGVINATYKAAPSSRYKSKAIEQLSGLFPKEEQFVPTAAPLAGDFQNDMPQTFDGGF